MMYSTGIHPRISTRAEDSYLVAATADVNFIVKTGRKKKSKRTVRIPAHKILLKFRSDVFSAMFYGDLAEKGDVQIIDATADAFKEFLKTFYFDKPDITMEYIPEVLELVRKYNVTGGLDYFDNVLQQSVTIDNLSWIYEMALAFELTVTKSHCEQQISLKAAELFQTSNFLECSYQTVFKIVSLNNFVCEEHTIFQACVEWAKKQCLRDGIDNREIQNVRKKLQGILYKIRFRSMNSSHVSRIISKYHGFLTKDELADIAFLALTTTDDARRTLISQEYRNHAWDTGALMTCFFIDDTESRKVELKHFESVSFSSNVPIIVRQIRLGSVYVNNIKVDGYEPLHLKFQIVQTADSYEEVLYTTSYRNAPLKFGNWFTLPKMIFIQPLVRYDIRLEYWDLASENRYFARGRLSSDLQTRAVHCGYERIAIGFSGSVTSISGIKFCMMPPLTVNKSNE